MKGISSDSEDRVILSLTCVEPRHIKSTILNLGFRAGFFIVVPEVLEFFKTSMGVRPIVDPGFFNEPNAGEVTRELAANGAAYIVVGAEIPEHMIEEIKANRGEALLMVEVADKKQLYQDGKPKDFSWVHAVMSPDPEILAQFSKTKVLHYPRESQMPTRPEFERALQAGAQAFVVHPLVQKLDEGQELYQPVPLFNALTSALDLANSKAGMHAAAT